MHVPRDCMHVPLGCHCQYRLPTWELPCVSTHLSLCTSLTQTILHCAGGGTYSFLAEAALLGSLPPADEQLLDIEAVNFNGMQCSRAGGGNMRYGDCLEPPSATAGANPLDSDMDLLGGGSSSGACWTHYCCGVVLLESPAPQPPQSPEPDAPPIDVPQAESPAAPSVPEQSPGPQAPTPLPQPDDSSPGRRSSSAIAAAAGGGGTAAAMVLVTAALLLRRQRQRRRQQTDAAFILKAEATSSTSSGDGGSISLASCDGGEMPLQLMAAVPGPANLSTILSPPSGGMLLRQGGSVAAAAAAGEAAGASPTGCQVTITPSIPATPDKVAPGAQGSSCSAGGDAGECMALGSEAASLAEGVVLKEQLGSGAFGTVYAGVWRGRPVAVKVLQTACGSSSRELESFRQEARVLSSLKHPNIVCFLAACTGEWAVGWVAVGLP